MDLFGLAMTRIFEPGNLLLLIGGGLAGIIVGCLPGLTATMALALLGPLPLICRRPADLLCWAGCMWGPCLAMPFRPP